VDTAIIDPAESGAIRVKGTVKWFDPVKGFGFIVSKDVVAMSFFIARQKVWLQEVLEGATVDDNQGVRGLRRSTSYRRQCNGVSGRRDERRRQWVRRQRIEWRLAEAADAGALDSASRTDGTLD
jgi:hypothetical protein